MSDTADALRIAELQRQVDDLDALRIAELQRQVDDLSRETLDRYRQINLLYRIGESISKCLGQEDICKLVLRESRRIVRARGGQIVLDDGLVVGSAPDAPMSSLSIPIETAQGHLGDIFLYDKRGCDFFPASDDKLVRALSRQAGIALVNNNLIEGLRHHNEDLERLNEQLKALDQMKSDFVSNVSHELRTPLASIKGFAATILDDDEMPQEVMHEFVGIINDESDKLIVIINDILDVSKLLAGKMQYEMMPQPLGKVVQSVVMLLRIQAEEKGLELTLTSEVEAIVDCDRTRISQVFTNLVGNAIKFTDEGHVRLRQWVTGGEVHVEISDTGLGIEPEQLPQIFDKFYRIENVVHTKEGTGLGLALVRTILEQHHGRVTALSEAGEGAVFTVHLPVFAD